MKLYNNNNKNDNNLNPELGSINTQQFNFFIKGIFLFLWEIKNPTLYPSISPFCWSAGTSDHVTWIDVELTAEADKFVGPALGTAK